MVQLIFVVLAVIAASIHLALSYRARSGDVSQNAMIRYSSGIIHS